MTETAKTIYRDYESDGIPDSGKHKPKKEEIRAWGTRLEAGILGGSAGAAVFVLKSELDVALTYPANSMAWVIGDPVIINNGIYRKSLGSGTGYWTRVADLPFEFIKASNVGAGTANAIVATTSLPIPENDAEALIVLPIAVANTASPVTVSFNGGTALTIKTSSGSHITVGGLAAGSLAAGYKSGTTFRLLSDLASAAIQVAAEAAVDLAQAWAEGTEPAGPGTKSAKEWAEDVGGIALGIASFNFAGDGVQTNFTLPVAPNVPGNCRLAIDGVAQQPTTAYTVSGTTLSFTAPPPNGSSIFGFIITAVEIGIGVPDPGSVGAAQIDQTDAPGIIDAIDAQALYAACQGRLTLTTAVPVTTADVTAAATVYWTAYMGGRVWLYSGTLWAPFTLAELSLVLSGGTASRPHDVFMDYNGGIPQLVLTAWTNDTTRATALALLNGILVKNGTSTQRYLGTIYLDASKQCADSLAKRHVWNMYNRKPRLMLVKEATDSWTYSSVTVRQTNANAANQLDFVRGLDEDPVRALTAVSLINSTATARLVVGGIGLDSTTTIATDCIRCGKSLINNYNDLRASYDGLPGLGRHVLTWLEAGGPADTQTWVGDNGGGAYFQSGISGSVFA